MIEWFEVELSQLFVYYELIPISIQVPQHYQIISGPDDGYPEQVIKFYTHGNWGKEVCWILRCIKLEVGMHVRNV